MKKLFFARDLAASNSAVFKRVRKEFESFQNGCLLQVFGEHKTTSVECSILSIDQAIWHEVNKEGS